MVFMLAEFRGFFDVFPVLRYLFLTYLDESTHLEMPKMLKFYQYSWISMIFFDFFEVFRRKLFCAARFSHVVCTIRFLIKFHSVMFICGHWEGLRENSFIPKMSKIGILRGPKLRRFTPNQINLRRSKIWMVHWKIGWVIEFLSR